MKKLMYIALVSFFVLFGCSKGKDASVEAQDAASLASEALARKEYGKAEDYAAKAIKLKPHVVEYWTGLGMAEAAQGKNKEARRSYERALELLEAEAKQRYLDQALLLVYLGRDYEAQEKIEQYKEEDPIPNLSLSTFLTDETEIFRTK